MQPYGNHLPLSLRAWCTVPESRSGLSFIFVLLLLSQGIKISKARDRDKAVATTVSTGLYLNRTCGWDVKVEEASVFTSQVALRDAI